MSRDISGLAATRSAVASRGRMRTAALACALLLTLMVAGCTGDPNSVTAQARSGDRKGYLSGDGTIEQIPPDRRGPPVQLSGTTLDGATYSLAAGQAGQYTVLNVWGSWCGPCVAEAPQLQAAWVQLSTTHPPVAFLGLNFKEGPEAGLAFQRRYQVGYPSLTYDGGRPVQALQGQAPTVPTTVILDSSRRIAGRILGQTDTATLVGLVADLRRLDPASPSAASDPGPALTERAG